MNAPHIPTATGLSVAAALAMLVGCASSGARPSETTAEPSATTAQAGTAAHRRTNAFVLTAAEIAATPGIMNAHDAVQNLRPQFLRPRGGASRPVGLVAAGAERQATGRRPGQVQGPPSGGSESGSRGESAQSAGGPVALEDPGIVVYLDRQRYGRVATLREIAVATVEEIRFLNVGEANSLFGMGHPHGVIQIITKRGLSPQ